MTRKRYRPRSDRFVVAVQLDLDTDGFKYRKWGHEQYCMRGDWLVESEGEVHTVAAESFARTYRALRPGHYAKTTPVWAERAVSAGSVATKEGRTGYGEGDWLVSNNEDGTDAYSILAAKFEDLYEADE